jgi:hypothetical protein
LRKVNVDRLVFRYFLIELIRIFHRTVFDTCPTAGTFVFDNIPGFRFQGYLEVTLVAFYGVNFRKCQNLYVWMPADLDQFG